MRTRKALKNRIEYLEAVVHSQTLNQREIIKVMGGLQKTISNNINLIEELMEIVRRRHSERLS